MINTITLSEKEFKDNGVLDGYFEYENSRIRLFIRFNKYKYSTMDKLRIELDRFFANRTGNGIRASFLSYTTERSIADANYDRALAKLEYTIEESFYDE